MATTTVTKCCRDWLLQAYKCWPCTEPVLVTFKWPTNNLEVPISHARRRAVTRSEATNVLTTTADSIIWRIPVALMKYAGSEYDDDSMEELQFHTGDTIEDDDNVKWIVTDSITLASMRTSWILGCTKERKNT